MLRGACAPLAVFALLLLTALSVHMATAEYVELESVPLNVTGQAVLRLLPGTPANVIYRPVQYSGVVQVNLSELLVEAAGLAGNASNSSNVTVSIGRVNATLHYYVTSPLAGFNLSGSHTLQTLLSDGVLTAYVTVNVTFDNGTYTGEEEEEPLVYTVRLYLDVEGTVTVGNETVNVTLTVVVPLDPEWVRFEPVGIVAIELADPPVDMDSIGYAAYPPEPRIGDTLWILPVGTARFQLVLTARPTYGSSVVVEYKFPNVEGVYASTIYVPATSRTVTFLLYDVYVTLPTTLTVKAGGLTLASDTLNPSVGLGGPDQIGWASLLIATPDILEVSPGQYTVRAVYYVQRLSGGELALQITVLDVSSPYYIVTRSGFYTEPNVTVSGVSREQIRGNITLYYSNSYGTTTQEIRVPFKASGTVVTGNIVGVLYNFLLYSFFVGGIISMVIGLFARNPGMQVGGFFAVLVGVVVLFMPAVISRAIVLAVESAGLNSPVPVTQVSASNLGEVYSQAITFVTERLNTYASRMAGGAQTLLTVVGIITFISMVLGAASLVPMLSATIGAIMNFIMQHLRWVIMAISILYLLAGILSILAVLYPLIMNFILALLLVTAVFYAYSGALSGDFRPLVSTAVSLSIVLTAVLILPALVTVLDQYTTIRPIYDVEIPLGPLKSVFERIAGTDRLTLPIFDIGRPIVAVAVKIVLLAMIIRLAWERLMSMLMTNR